MKFIYVLLAGVVGAMVFVAFGSRVTPVAQESAASLGAASPKTVREIKEKRVKEAMLGLSYQTGRVTLTSDAAKVAQPGTAAEVAAQQKFAHKTLIEENKWVEGIAAYTKAVIMDPKNAESYLGLGKALLTEAEPAEALAAVRTAADLAPNNAKVQFELGYMFHRMDELDLAIGAFERSLQLDPKNGEAHARVAILAYYLHQNEKALQHVGLADKLGGDVPPQFRELLKKQIAADKGA